MRLRGKLLSAFIGVSLLVLAAIILGVVLALIIGIIMATRIFRPLRRITDQAQQLHGMVAKFKLTQNLLIEEKTSMEE